MALALSDQRGPGWAAAVAWARSGVMALCGWPDGPPLLPPLELPGRLDAICAEIEQRTASRGHPVRVSWAAALAGRAALLGLRRQGQISANGSCRLLPTGDGWAALSLPRPDDIDLVPALTRGPAPPAEAWTAVAAAAGCLSNAEFVERSRMLGLAAAALPEPGKDSPNPTVITARGAPRDSIPTESWTVVDLSSLWAGPVVARVLGAAGASVVRVESGSRPDGARTRPAFYEWLHSADEAVVTVDLSARSGRQRVADLIDGADVVIEGSRPRALQHLGLDPDVRPGPAGQVWLSITGYGREAPGCDWVAFGDDAAVAGGLVGWDGSGRPVFCGDAMADPLTGLVGAVAALRALDGGGGQLVDLSMSRVAATMAATRPPVESDARVELDPGAGRCWRVRGDTSAEPVRPRPPSLRWIDP